MKNLVKAKIVEGEHPLGTFFHSGSEIAAECLGYAGLDYFIIDTEHGPFDVQSSLDFIRAGKYSGCTPFARVKDGTRASVLKMLDAGAMGIIVPNVRSVEEVREIVSYGKYFPMGERGIAATPGSHYWTQSWAGLDHYMLNANDQTMLIPQCETVGCLENIEEIVAINGVDGIFVGPFDLSAALGRPGDFTNPDHIAAIDRVLTACQQAGKASFIFATTEDEARRRYDQGFDSVTYSMDSLVLIEAMRQVVARLGEGS